MDPAECSIRGTENSNVFMRTRKKKKKPQKIVLKPRLHCDDPSSFHVDADTASASASMSLDSPNSDVWDLKKLRHELQDLNDVVSKRREITVRTNAPTTFGLRKSFHLWRDGRLRDEYYQRMEELQLGIKTAEESIRLWMSAVVMQKWSSRREAMTFINDLDASIALHEFRLDSLDDLLEDCKSVISSLIENVRSIVAMLVFNEVNVCQTFLHISQHACLQSIVHQSLTEYDRESESGSSSGDEDDDDDDGFVGFTMSESAEFPTTRKSPPPLGAGFELLQRLEIRSFLLAKVLFIKQGLVLI